MHVTGGLRADRFPLEGLTRFDILMFLSTAKCLKVSKQGCRHLRGENCLQMQFESKSPRGIRCFIMPAKMIAPILYSAAITAITRRQNSKKYAGGFSSQFFSTPYEAEVH